MQPSNVMNMFECGGWVTIWASPEESDCFVCIRHLDCHQKYVCIDIPDDVKKFIAENPKLRAPQFWKEILKLYPRPNFTQKAVYNYWFKQQQASWQHCNDEFESAKILLQEFANDPVHKLVSIPMPESDGFRALGFVFLSVIRKWNGVIREVALDSTLRQRVRVVLKYTAKIELPQSLFVGGSLTKKSQLADLGAQSYGTFGATATELEERFQLKDSGFITEVPLGLGNCDRTRRTIPTADLGAQSYGTFV
ncbi:hypothetical protein C8R43DRAFT_963057 [Mycena crocata]|nr:hypothetical protein C8R43DRAFT_963057 [Mycena crocata]